MRRGLFRQPLFFTLFWTTFLKYCNIRRWDTYFKQLELAYTTGSKSFLIIGPGDHIVPIVLKHILPNAIVDTFDIRDGSTYQGDLRDISNIVNKKYDCVLCCEVLEHIEFDYFDDIIKQLRNISNTLIVSLPYHKPYHKEHICQYHKWEINYKGIDIKRLIDIFERYFIGVKTEFLQNIEFFYLHE